MIKKVEKKAPKRVVISEPEYTVRVLATAYGFDPTSYKFRAFLNRYGLEAAQLITESKFKELFEQRYKQAL